jgi:hypothetical protein
MERDAKGKTPASAPAEQADLAIKKSSLTLLAEFICRAKLFRTGNQT